MQTPDYFRLAVHQRILGDIESEHFKPGTNFDQVLNQKALGTTDIEHTIAAFKAKVLDDVFGNRNPSPVIAIAAIADFARAVEVLLTELSRKSDVPGRLCLFPL